MPAPAGPAARAVATLEAKPATIGSRSSRSAAAKPKRRRRAAMRIWVVSGLVIGCVAGAGVGVKLLMSKGQPHSIGAPSRLGQFVEAPALAASSGASTLRSEIVANSNGEASNVVDAVYEQTPNATATSSPVIIVFVGGNLSGSAGSFIDSLTRAVPGAFVTSPGSMPGQAACIPGQAGHSSTCVWADNDTFGVIASPSLSPSALAAELRLVRPLIEHAKK